MFIMSDPEPSDPTLPKLTPELKTKIANLSQCAESAVHEYWFSPGMLPVGMQDRIYEALRGLGLK